MQRDPGAQSAFATPAGIGGRVAGWVMAALNARMNRIALELLDASDGARVLEVGFGPGSALAELLAAPVRLVAGVDPSEAMHAQARARNLDAVERGRLVLHLGTADRIPYADASFSHVLTVNSFQIWPEPGAALRELHRVLVPGGRLLVAVRQRSPSGRRPFDGIALDEARIARAEGEIGTAGFRALERIVRPAGWMTACCLRARA